MSIPSPAGDGGPVWAPGYAHASAGLPPTRFRFRVQAEDFVVEELPLYQPSGRGTHLWLWIEKRGLGTLEAVERIARALHKRSGAIGYAGRKDARAVTRQWLSVEHADPERVRALAVPGVSVLDVRPSERKLRLGQLAGNRFELVLREVEPGGEARLRAVLEHLGRTGLPNYYGSQRFGREGLTWRLGALLVAGRYEEYVRERVRPDHAAPSHAQAELARVVEEGSRSQFRGLSKLAGQLDDELAALARQLARRPRHWEWAVRSLSKRVRAFHVSALQSRVFNRVLASRLPRLAEVLPGDLLLPLAVPTVESGQDPRGGQLVPVPLDAGERLLAQLTRRSAEFELAPSGPLPGLGTPLAEGEPGREEHDALVAEGLACEDFAGLAHGLAPRGARRPLRVPLRRLALGPGPGPDSLHLRFELPRGSYATTLLEELRKDHARPAPPAA